uniref:Alpha-galactosidase n=1 Tax=Panagrolaimus sp. ES5 TaxID=591445 RepID=A0AC34FXS2_9BILA
MVKLRNLIAIFLFFAIVESLNNGLVRTPPMGWMSWTKFYCEIDCVNHPKACINEDLYASQADRMAKDGYKDVGYEYIHIDDCWMSMQRDRAGRLTANATRFPHGIKWLADYVHNLGLKFAIYEDYGTKTCACSWPAYLISEQDKVNYTEISQHCNLWRNFDDISRSWKSILSIIDWYNLFQDKMAAVHGPGQWNDPDMIIAGNSELTDDQARAQMTIWSIWSAPLIMSNDLRDITPGQKEILQNKEVIAIDQDPLGHFGKLIVNTTDVYVYAKKVTPVDPSTHEHSWAIAVLNKANFTVGVSVKASILGMTNPSGYKLRDLWAHKNIGFLKGSEAKIEAKVPATGVTFYKATIANK